MEHFELDWTEFLELLPRWAQLPLSARTRFLTEGQTDHIRDTTFGPDAEPLVQRGFYERVPANPRRLRLPRQLKPARRALRALQRHPVFERSAASDLRDYLHDHFSAPQIAYLMGRRTGYHSYIPPEELESRLASVEWVNAFLKIPNPIKAAHWEDQHSDIPHGGRGLLWDAAALRATQELVRHLSQQDGPIPLAELRSRLPQCNAPQLAGALNAALCYALAFVALRSHDLEPVLGLWPAVLKRLNRRVAQPPAPVTPEQSLSRAFLVEDMTVILAACTADPLRIQRDGRSLYARHLRELESRAAALPAWTAGVLRYAIDDRIRVALAYLRALEYAATQGEAGVDLRLAATPAGTRWLAQDGKQRLKSLLDRFHNPPAKSPSPHEHTEYDTVFNKFTPRGSDLFFSQFFEDVIEAFRPLEPNAFVALGAFLQYHAEHGNPLVEKWERAHADREPYAYYYDPFYWLGHEPTAEQKETLWKEYLTRFFTERLLPLGGVAFGIASQSACFALTDVGRYFLGLAGDFEYGADEKAEVIVQPNFEIVFLAPSPSLEASLSRFAERIGKHVGVLFRITKKSIYAAAAGMTFDDAVQALRRHASRKIPDNVEREMRGWFGQCRRLAARPSVLLPCPDAETAARVLGVAGRRVTPLTETILEIAGGRLDAQMIRKLRESGVFIEQPPARRVPRKRTSRYEDGLGDDLDDDLDADLDNKW